MILRLISSTCLILSSIQASTSISDEEIEELTDIQESPIIIRPCIEECGWESISEDDTQITIKNKDGTIYSRDQALYGDLDFRIFCTDLNADNFRDCLCLNSGVMPEITDEYHPFTQESLITEEAYNTMISTGASEFNCDDSELIAIANQIHQEEVIEQLSDESVIQSLIEEDQARLEEAERQLARLEARQARNEARRAARRLEKQKEKRDEYLQKIEDLKIEGRSLGMSDIVECSSNDSGCEEKVEVANARVEHRRNMKVACITNDRAAWDAELDHWMKNDFNFRQEARHCCIWGSEVPKFVINYKMITQDGKPVVCHNGKWKSLSNDHIKDCKSRTNQIVKLIKQQNNENSENAPDISIFETKNPANARKLAEIYRYDNLEEKIVKMSLTLTCPEGYHFYSADVSLEQSRYMDWYCDEDFNKDNLPKCRSNQELDNNENSGAIDLLAELMEANDLTDEASQNGFLEFLKENDKEMYEELQHITNDNDLDLQARILGGRAVPTGSAPMYPWQVFLDMNNAGFCGGVIMTHNLFFTAAHCIKAGELEDGEKRQLSKVYAGVTDQNLRHESSAKILTECHVHRDYRISNQIMQNDIAYCLVSPKFDFSETNIAPACLPNYSDSTYDNANCYATGYGTESKYFL